MPKQVRNLQGYRIRPYTHGWELQGNYSYFDGKRTGEVIWEADGYYGDFNHAVAAVIDKNLQMTLDGEDPKKLFEAIELAKQEAIKVAKEFGVALAEAQKSFKETE